MRKLIIIQSSDIMKDALTDLPYRQGVSIALARTQERSASLMS
ncbi:MAG TPA: hypothetical protein VK211_25300 [Kamptonema sp.]|nr:hypothetical protein [Kamptonema sp.]